jgi:hypothetical protein
MTATKWILLLVHIAYVGVFLWIFIRVSGRLLDSITNGNLRDPALPLAILMEVAAAVSAIGIAWALGRQRRLWRRKPLLAADGLGLALGITVLSPMIFADYSPLIAGVLGLICIVATVTLTPFARSAIQP